MTAKYIDYKFETTARIYDYELDDIQQYRKREYDEVPNVHELLEQALQLGLRMMYEEAHDNL